MTLEEAIKKSIQSYLVDKQDVQSEDGKYTLDYFDKFEDNLKNGKKEKEEKEED